MAQYVRNKGPKVTKVSIFRNKKYRSVVIRLNVEDDEKSHLLTDDPNFWPKGIHCRPWLTHNGYKKRYDVKLNNGEQHDQTVHSREHRTSHSHQNQQYFENTNMYSTLYGYKD
jgi:hypothetical protein